MAEPLVISFAADTSRAQSAMATLASQIVGNMAQVGVAMSGGAANSNGFGAALGTLQSNAQKAAAAVGRDVTNIANSTANAATKQNATLEGVIRAFTASAAGSETAAATVKTSLTTTTAAVQGVASQLPTLQGLLAAFLAFEAAKLVFASVAASIEQARQHIADFVKIGKDAERLGVGTDFFQRATLGADKFGLSVQQVAAALEKAREASATRIGEGEHGSNTSAIDQRLEQNVRAGNLSRADKAAFDGATDQEGRIRVVLGLIDKLRGDQRDLAAFDLAGKFFGADFENKLRSGVDLTRQLRDTLDSTSTTVAGVRIIGADEVERARELDAKAKDIADTFATVLAPIQRDISTAVLDTYQAFLNVEAAVARVVAVAVSLYQTLSGIVGQVRDLVGSIPGIGKMLTASNPITFLQEYGRAVGVIDPEVQGPPAPLSVKVKPRGADRSAVLPAVNPKRGREGSESESLDAVETLINQLEKARDTAKAELENVEKTNVERERAVALAKAEAAAREEVKKGNRASPELDADERSRVLSAADAMQKYKDATLDAQQALRQTADTARYFGTAASDAFADAILEGRSFGDILQNLEKQIARAALSAVFTGQGPLAGLLGTATKASAGSTEVGGLAGLIGGFFRANGGPVEAGRPYTVGEMGREMFIPNVNGQIVPIAAAGAGGGAPSVSIINNTGTAAEPTVQQRPNGGMEITLDRLEARSAGRMAAGRGPFAAAIPGSRRLRG